MKLAFSVTEPFLQILCYLQKTMLFYFLVNRIPFILVSVPKITHPVAKFNPAVQKKSEYIGAPELFIR